MKQFHFIPSKTYFSSCQVKDYVEKNFLSSCPVEGVAWYSKEDQVHKY